MHFLSNSDYCTLYGDLTRCLLLSIMGIQLTACKGGAARQVESQLGHQPLPLTESAQVDKYPAFPNAVAIRKQREITLDTSLQENTGVTQVVCLIQLADEKVYSVLLYQMQPVRGEFDKRIERFLPIQAVIPVPFPKGVTYIPDSPEVKKIFFLLRKSKEHGDNSKWRFFDYPKQDWAGVIQIPSLNDLPFCTDSPVTAVYPMLIDEAKRLYSHLFKFSP
jgi:hypothetical protein